MYGTLKSGSGDEEATSVSNSNPIDDISLNTPPPPGSGRNLFQPPFGATSVSKIRDALEETEADAEDQLTVDSSSQQTNALPGHKRSKVIHFKRIGALTLYAVPEARYQWGQEQGAAHTAWAQVFFDLPFVGVASQVAHIFSHGLVQDQRCRFGQIKEPKGVRLILSPQLTQHQCVLARLWKSNGANIVADRRIPRVLKND